MCRKQNWAIICIALALLWSVIRTDDVRAAEPASWHAWLELGGYFGTQSVDRTGSRTAGRGEATLFAPIVGGQQDLLFGQLTGKLFRDDVREGNFALGYRHMLQSGFNIGGWIAADVRQTEIGNEFWQLSGGFEALSHDLDARLNWYGPTSSPQSGAAGFTQVQVVGNQIAMTGGQEVALSGIDGEIGFRIPLEYAGLQSDVLELRAYGGGYHFDASEALRSVSGAKGRLELRFNDVISAMPGSRLTAEYEVTRDAVRDTRHDLGLQFRIPFGNQSDIVEASERSPQRRRMLDGIKRDTDIVTTHSDRELVEDALTGTDFDRVAIVPDGGDLTGTSATAGDNSLIILNGEVVGTQTLAANQTLQGGGSTILVRGRSSGATVSFTASGSKGRLTTPGSADNLILSGSNTHVTGVTIVGDGTDGSGSNDGIELGSGKTNMFVTNTTITDVGDNGIDVDDDTTLTVLNASIARTGNDGIEFDNRNVIAITGGTVIDTSDEGIDGEDSNTVSIAMVRIENAGDDGINFGNGNRATIHDTRILDTYEDAISVGNDNEVNVSDTRIEGAFSGVHIGHGFDGIFGTTGRNKISLVGTTISDAEFGLGIFGEENEVSLSNATISNIGFTGVYIFGFDNTIRVSSSRFSDIGFDAFSLFARTTLLVQDTTFAGTIGGDLFYFDGPDSVILDGSSGNVNDATIGGRICEAGGGPNAFTGTIAFVDGTTLTDDVAPCN